MSIKLEGVFSIPDGVYQGKWTAYVVRFEWPGHGTVQAKTVDVGVRGINVPCVVQITGGIATVRA